MDKHHEDICFIQNILCLETLSHDQNNIEPKIIPTYMIDDDDKIEYGGHPFDNSHNASTKVSYTCYFCEESVSGVVVRHYKNGDNGQLIHWLLCPNCSHGSVKDRDNNVYPILVTGEKISGLSGIVKKSYEEAKICFSVQAYTACELLCRKLLMHIAADKGAEEGKSFQYYIEYLQDKGYVSSPMKSWVDLIRQHGNISAHEIEEPNKQRAENTLTFTALLLKFIYEAEHFASKYTK